MTRVDFHILGTEDIEQAIRHVCRVTDKAWRSGHRILIFCDPELLDTLDARLWDFRPEAFLPHCPLADGEAPVNLTTDTDCGDHHDVLLTLSRRQNTAFSRFNRLIEVVFRHADWTPVKRDHFRFYRERGYPLHTHNL